MVIKFSALILLLFAISTHVSAQKVTIHKANCSLSEVLKIISLQTGYNVFYSSEIIKQSKNVTIHVSDQDVVPVLNKIFESQPFSYSIANETIVLTPVKSKAKELSIIIKDIISIKPNSSLLRGRVHNIAGKPLTGVSIVNTSDPKGYKTSSDKYGEFVVRAFSGDSLKFSSLGFKDRIYRCNEQDNIIIEMNESTIEISDVTVEAAAKEKLNLNTQIDLTNKSYMNLAQVLQGSVPGLTLQFQPSNRRNVVSIDYLARDPLAEGNAREYVNYSPEQFLRRFQPFGQQIIDAL